MFPQCSVENEVGETRGDGCLTIVLAIDVKYQPQPTQDVVQGDEIDLTVQASWETGELLMLFVPIASIVHMEYKECINPTN